MAKVIKAECIKIKLKICARVTLISEKKKLIFYYICIYNYFFLAIPYILYKRIDKKAVTDKKLYQLSVHT